MATCVVTGGAGFLGSHLCDHLLEKGHRVICIDNLDTGSLENIAHIGKDADFTFVSKDLSEPPVTVDEDVDFVYHLASPASPIDYARLPLHTLKVGSYGTHHMLGLAKFKRARFLLASTSEVYGDPQVHPQSEDYWGHVNPIGPRGVYDEAKRYAEAMTMAYHRQQGVDTCIVRIFNSVLADEQILYDDGRELRRETAGELAARMFSFAGAIMVSPNPSGGSGGTALLDAAPAKEWPLSGYTVPAFGDGGEIGPSEAASFIGHPTSQTCFEVKTRYGRSIRVTGDHSVFVEGPDGEPTPKPTRDLEIGERIAIAGRIDVPERDRRLVSMLEVWRWAEKDPWELWVEAPGLGAKVWERRFDLHGLLTAKRRGSGPNWRNTAWTQIIRMRDRDRVPAAALWAVGEAVPDDATVRARSGNSELPALIEITDELLWFLGLWVAEGSWHVRAKDSHIAISGDAVLLERAAAIAERVFGLHATRIPESPARAASITISSKLIVEVLSFLGFDHGRKRIPGWILGLPLSRLKWFIEGYREGDGVHSGKEFERAVAHAFSTVTEELKNDLLVALGRFGIVASVGRYRTRFRKRTGERTYPYWRISVGNVHPWSPLEWDRGVAQKLNAKRHGDLVWAAVRKIEEVPATDLVFDFSVPGRENFLAGTGVLARNTMGNRMRPHDGRAIPTFLRQALQDKPLTVFGDGQQTRSFCFVDDLIRGLIALMESDVHLPVNIGNPDEFTLLEAAQTVIEVTDSRSEIVFEALPVDDPQQRQPDITRARELLGWEPQVSLREALQLTVERAGVERLVGAPE
jgi:UDP-glucuronate decarboxylase